MKIDIFVSKSSAPQLAAAPRVTLTITYSGEKYDLKGKLLDRIGYGYETPFARAQAYLKEHHEFKSTITAEQYSGWTVGTITVTGTKSQIEDCLNGLADNIGRTTFQKSRGEFQDYNHAQFVKEYRDSISQLNHLMAPPPITTPCAIL